MNGFGTQMSWLVTRGSLVYVAQVTTRLVCRDQTYAYAELRYQAVRVCALKWVRTLPELKAVSTACYTGAIT